MMRTCQHISDRSARVVIANMRACHAWPKSLLNITNVARQDALNASLYNLDRNQSILSRHVQNTLLSVDTMFVSHYTDCIEIRVLYCADDNLLYSKHTFRAWWPAVLRKWPCTLRGHVRQSPRMVDSRFE